MPFATPRSKSAGAGSLEQAAKAFPREWSHSRGRRHSWIRTRRRVFGVFLAPSLAVLVLVTLLPLVFHVATSFTPQDMSNPASLRWSGLTNYRELTRDGRFWNSVWVQARLSFWTVSLQLVVGLAIALLLNGRMRLLGLVRATFIVPMVVPPVVVALIWKILFTPDISILDWALGLLRFPQPAWLVDPEFALWAIIIADVWEWFPFVMLISAAACGGRKPISENSPASGGHS